MNDVTFKDPPTKIRLPSDGPVRISTVLNLPEPFNVGTDDEHLTVIHPGPYTGDIEFKPWQVKLVKTVNGDAVRSLGLYHLDYYFSNTWELPLDWAKKTEGGETKVIVFPGTILHVKEHKEPMFAYLKCSRPAMFPKRVRRWIPGLILTSLVVHPQNHIFHALLEP